MSQRTDRLIKRVGKVVVLLLVQILQQLRAKLELFAGGFITTFELSALLWDIGIGQVFGWRWMNFALWSPNGFLDIAPSNYRHRCRRSSNSGGNFLGRRSGHRRRWRRWRRRCFLRYDNRLGLE